MLVMYVMNVYLAWDMKNKLPLTITISAIYMIFLGVVVHQLVSNYNISRLYMAIAAIIFVIAAYFLTLRSFIPLKPKIQ
jgi:hypothetical protein